MGSVVCYFVWSNHFFSKTNCINILSRLASRKQNEPNHHCIGLPWTCMISPSALQRGYWKCLRPPLEVPAADGRKYMEYLSRAILSNCICSYNASHMLHDAAWWDMQPISAGPVSGPLLCEEGGSFFIDVFISNDGMLNSELRACRAANCEKTLRRGRLK